METGLVKKIREELRLLERRLELCDRVLESLDREFFSDNHGDIRSAAGGRLEPGQRDPERIEKPAGFNPHFLNEGLADVVNALFRPILVAFERGQELFERDEGSRRIRLEFLVIK